MFFFTLLRKTYNLLLNFYNKNFQPGTSIGANIKEGLFAQSKRDFLSKMNIALKESSETIYWLELLTATNYLDTNASKDIVDESIEINKILVSIVKTTKENLNNNGE